jgi:hypothetical protein
MRAKAQESSLTDEERAAALQLAREIGTLPAATRLGASYGAFVRAVAGFPVRAGTAAMIRAGLVGATPATPAAKPAKRRRR